MTTQQQRAEAIVMLAAALALTKHSGPSMFLTPQDTAALMDLSLDDESSTDQR